MPKKNHMKDLYGAMEASYKDLKPFREASLSSIEEYCGPHYGSGRDDKKRNRVPVNYLQMAISVYMQQLISAEPRFKADSKNHVKLRHQASMLTLALNHLSNEIGLRDTIEEIILQAFFSIGIGKVGTTFIPSDMNQDATQPYVEPVGLDDYVHDTSVKRYRECRFVGHRYRMDYDAFMKMDIFDEKARKRVQPFDPMAGESMQPTKRVSAFSSSREADVWEYRKQVELWEVWLPQENRIVTFPENGAENLLLDIPWSGSERGPYHLLSFHAVPDNIMPLPPVQLWRDLHRAANDTYAKLRNQAARQKKLTAYQPSSKDDAKRIRDANDGEMVPVADARAINEIALGGIDQVNMAFFLQTRELFNFFSGNIDAVGGLGPQSDTVGQDAMIQQSSNQRVEQMRQRVLTFTKGIGEALGDELWYNPDIKIPLVKEAPNTGVSIPVTFDTEKLEGDFLDYNINIMPQSMNIETPAQKLSKIQQILQTMVFPALPMIQQQGGSLNAQEMIELIAENANLPELRNLVVFEQPYSVPASEPVMSQGGGEQAPTMPQQTSREYIRRNVPTSGTREGRDHVMSQMLMGQNPQPKESNVLGRM